MSGPTHESPSEPVFDTGGTGTRLRITLQQRLQGTTDIVGWTPIGEPSAVRPSPDRDAGAMIWEAEIALPPPRGFERRLLVEEIEWHLTIDPNAGGLVEHPAARVVFVETIPL